MQRRLGSRPYRPFTYGAFWAVVRPPPRRGPSPQRPPWMDLCTADQSRMFSRKVGCGIPRHHDAVRCARPGTNPKDHDRAAELIRWQKTPRLRRQRQRSRWSISRPSESPEVSRSAWKTWPSCRAWNRALSESLQGSMSNEFDEQVFNGAAGELNGLFTQAAAVSAATAIETYTTGIARFGASG